MPAGRPRIVESPEDIDERLDAYMAECKEDKKPPLLSEMVQALGFNSKQSFYEYGKKPEFIDSIKRARLCIEIAYERGLHSTTPTGAIFALKNMDWKDKTELSSDPENPVFPVLNVFNSGG